MAGGIPFPSRHGLQWQLVLLDPRLLTAAQARLAATGPSHAIEEALRLALRCSPTLPPPEPPVH
jgi:hypothetical protein